MLVSQNDIFRQKYFRNIFLFLFYPGETRVVENTDTEDIIENSLVHMYKFFWTDLYTFFSVFLENRILILYFCTTFRKLICFFYVGKRKVFFERKVPTYHKTVTFAKKLGFFSTKKLECVDKYVERCKNMTDSGILARHLWHLNRCDIPHMYKTLTILQTVLRIMGIIRKKKRTPLTDLNLFTSKRFFWRKIM